MHNHRQGFIRRASTAIIMDVPFHYSACFLPPPPLSYFFRCLRRKRPLPRERLLPRHRQLFHKKNVVPRLTVSCLNLAAAAITTTSRKLSGSFKSPSPHHRPLYPLLVSYILPIRPSSSELVRNSPNDVNAPQAADRNGCLEAAARVVDVNFAVFSSVAPCRIYVKKYSLPFRSPLHTALSRLTARRTQPQGPTLPLLDCSVLHKFDVTFLPLDLVVDNGRRSYRDR